MNTSLHLKIKQEINKSDIKNRIKVILIIYNKIFIILIRTLNVLLLKI